MTGELITDSSGNDAYTNPLTFSQWGGSIGNNVTDDKDKFIGYGNYLREFEFERGTLDADTEAAIGNIVNSQVTQIDPEYKPSLDSGTVDTDANLIFEAFGTQAKNDFLKAIEEGGKREDFSAEVNEAKRHLVEHGRLSLASLRTQDEDGSISYELIGDSNILDSRKAVAESLSRGAIRHRDMWQVAKGMEKGKSGVSTFKAIRDNQVRSEFSAASQAEDKELYNDVLKEAKEYFINNKEDSDPSTLITKARSLLAKGYSSDKGIEEKVSRSRFQDSDIMDALEQVALFESYQTGEAEFITDPNKLGDNIKVTKNGAVIPHINLILDGDKFDSALELRKDLTRSQKRSLENYRKDFFTRQFPRYNEFFQDSTVENKWAKAKVEGKQNGLSNGEILESFMSDSRNYSGLKNRLGALGASIADSFTGLAFIIPALFENKGAIDFLVSQEEDRQKRREIAKVFGDNFGFGMDVSTAIAPMVVDIGATILLSSFTYGAGGVAYIATKQGVNLTAKGAIKSLTGSVLTRQFGEDAGRTAARLKMKGYIKNSKRSDVIDAINTFNGLLTNKKGGASALVKGVQTSSLFLTAANRSAGATFATVYGNLEGTHEEKYDAALGAAMTAGMATGLITAGFSAVGAGGFEDAFLKGISAKQHRSLLERMSRSKLTKTQYGEIMKEYLSERIKEVSSTGFKDVYRRFFKSGSEEFLEEGIDEFVNSFIVDAALNEDTPMIDRVTGAMYAGAVGGVIGQGAAGVRSIAEKKGAFERGGIEMLRQSEENKLIEKLRESSSPLTANALMESLTRLELRRPSSTKETVEELNTRIGSQVEVTQKLEEERKKVEEAKQAAEDELGINIVMGTVSEDGRLAGVNPDTNQITIYKQHIKDDFNAEEILPYLTGSGGGATSAQKEIVFKDIDLVKFKQALGSVEQYQKFIEEHEKAHIRLGHKREGLETEQGIANEIAANEAAAEAIGLNWNSLKKVENEISSAPTPESRATQEENIRNILNGDLTPEQAAIKEQELRKQELDAILDGDDISMEGQEEVAEESRPIEENVRKRLKEINAKLESIEDKDSAEAKELIDEKRRLEQYLEGSEPEQTTQAEKVIHSGGAGGADTEFQKAALKAGFKVKAHSFKGHAKDNKQRVEHTQAELAEADEKLQEANKTLKRKLDTKKQNFSTNLLRRNWFQVKDADQVIAVSKLDKSGQVEGGTAWAVEMAKNEGIKVSIFDMNTNSWYSWDGSSYVESEPPTLSDEFAGIGARKLTDEGRAAIQNLFKEEQTTEAKTPKPPKVVYVERVQGMKSSDAVQKKEDDGEGINVLRKTGVGKKHYGNPFSHRGFKNTIPTKNLDQTVDYYRRWLEGDETFEHKDKYQNRRQWILEQIDSGALDGKNLLYYDENVQPNHAVALQEFIAKRRSTPPREQDIGDVKAQLDIAAQEQLDNELDQNPNQTTASQIRNLDPPTSFETLDKLRQDKVIKLQSLLNQLTMLGQTFGVDTKLVSDEQNIAANADGEPIKAFSYVLGETESYIQINPYEVYRLIDGLSDRNARSLTSSIVTEEIIHAATLADLSTEEITDYYNSLPASQIDSTIDSYYLTDSDRAAARARLTDADPEVVAKEQRTLAKESLRMHTQIGLRGFTSEQDRAFYLDNPNVVSVLLRYIKGFLNRIARALKNDKENPHLRVAVNRITQAYNDMRSGYMIGDVPLFDPDNPLKVVNTLRSEYEGDVNMPPEVGTVVEVTESQIVGDEEVETTKEVAFKHGDLTGMLTLPLMYTGDYKRKGKVMRWLTGQGDPRLRSLNQQATALRNTVFNEIQKYKTKLEFLIAEAYPEGDAPVELFKLITGDGETLKLDKKTKDFIETEFALRTKTLTRQLNALDEELKTTADKDKELERESVAEQLLELPELREKAFNLAFENKKAVLNQKREDAINQLGGYDDKGFPNNEIVLHLLELRKKTDAFSKKIAELYPNDKDAARKLKGTIDANLEIYITRSYRLFSDAGYADKVMNEAEYRTVREQAALIFMDEYVNLRSIQIVTNKEKDSDGNVITRIDDARDIAQKEIDYDEKTDDNISKTIHNMMVDYLNSFGSDVDPMVSPATLVSYDSAEKRLGFTSILKDRLKKRKEIPKQLRELMGEEGDNTGYDGIMRTYMHVGIMASHQAFIKNVIDFGMDKENNWIITGDQYDRIAGDSPDKNNYGVFKLDGSEFDLTKIRGKGRLYADKEMIATIKAMHDGLKTSLNETEVAAKQLNRAAQVLTGSSMAAKTLGSIGFYIRNAMSNVFYFGISQGMINPIKMTPQYMKNFRNEIARKRGFFGKEGRGGEDLDAYYSKLDALDIIGDEIRPKFLDEIFRGEETPNSLMNKIYDVTKKIQNESDENTTENDLKKTGSKLNKLYVSLQEMSAAMDTFYKITYFEHEVDVLRKARDAAKASTDPKENTGKYAKMTDYQIDRAAAEKVLSTAQSYSRSSPFVRGWTNSTLGVMFAPFIRFKAEVVRISVNTIRLSIEEIKDKESAVVRARGWKRLTGFLGTTVGLSAVAPLIARLITDVDDDEDAALRRTLVEYLQGHTFILYRDGEELKSLDFTYINPYALLADPVLRAVEKGFRGEGVGAMTMAFVDGLIFKEYLDDQIFAGALISLKANRDPQTNKKIYEERDTAYDAFYKGTTFLLKEAFEPRTIKAGREVATMIGTNPVDQIFKRIGAEFLPFKPYKIDISNNLRRYLFDVRRETQNISMRKNKVLSDRPISDSDMKSLVLDEIKHRVRLDKEVLHTLEHMGSLGGLSDKEVRDIVFGAQFGKRRYGFMMQGKTETPKETHKGLKKKLRDKYQLTGNSEFLRRERLLDAYFKSLPRFYYHDVED